MTLRKIFALAAIACLAAAAASAQPLSTAAGEAGSASFTEPEGGSMVLYDQTDSAAGNGAPDQDFEAGFDAYDAEGADDFDVTWPDGWDIEQVNTIGTTGTPGGATVDVNFYTDNGGTPLGGTQVCTYAAVTPTLDNMGSLTIDLPMPCVLDSGLNWVAIQVNQNFGTFGQHFWSNRSVQSNAPSKWRNPGDGFATGCLDWANQMGTLDGNPATGCGVGGGTNPDFLFSLVGVLGEPDVVVTEVPTLGQIGLIAMLVSLLGAGLYRLRRRK